MVNSRVFGANVETDKFTCFYCKRSIDDYSRTVDHLIPESRGGIKARANKVYCCRECNGLKDNMTPEEFHEHLGRLIRMLVSSHKRQIYHLKKVRLNTASIVSSRVIDSRKG